MKKQKNTNDFFTILCVLFGAIFSFLFLKYGVFNFWGALPILSGVFVFLNED